MLHTKKHSVESAGICFVFLSSLSTYVFSEMM